MLLLSLRRNTLHWLIGITALSSGATLPGTARADPILGPLTVTGFLDLGPGVANQFTINAPGVVAGATNFGTGTMTAVAGSTPNISVTFDVHDFGGTGGASGTVHMSYHMEYFNPGAAPNTQIVGTIHASNFLAQS